jgi:hypothetical protein
VSIFILIAADLVAMAILVFGLYYPRHRRRDMIAPFLAINVGVMGVTYAMATTDLSLGFGLGIFAVLSIIRLRSSEVEHAEIAYYFSAIAIGLLAGFPSISAAVSFTLMGVLVAVMAVGDHPALFSRNRHQLIVLDRAVPNDAAARDLLESMLGATVHRLTIRKVDFVSDTTVCDVRFSAPAGRVQGPDDTLFGSAAFGSAGVGNAAFGSAAALHTADAPLPFPENRGGAR